MRIMGKREWGSDAERMAENRRGGRDQQPPAIGNRDRRDSLQDDDAGWLRTYLPSVFRFPFTSAHRYYIETIGECLRYGVSKCVAAPRGDGKSSICRYLALKYALYRQIKFPLLVCATGAKASKTLKSIKQALRSGPRTPLGQDFPLETHLARYIAPWPSRANNATAFSLPIKSEWSDEHVIIPQLADHAEAPQEMIDRWGLDRDSGLAGIVMALGWTSVPFRRTPPGNCSHAATIFRRAPATGQCLAATARRRTGKTIRERHRKDVSRTLQLRIAIPESAG